MYRIVVLYPTRGRAPASIHSLTRAVEKLSGRHHVRIIIGIDTDDPTRLEAVSAMRQLHEAAHRKGARIEVRFGESTSKIHAANRLVPDLDSIDVLVGHSDDMELVADGWDDIVATALMTRFPDGDGYLQVHDGRRSDIATWPVVGAEFLRNLPYNPLRGGTWSAGMGEDCVSGPCLWNPVYTSVFPDDEMVEIARMRNRCHMLGDAPGSLVLHRHPAWGNRSEDETDRKWKDVYARDERIYRDRRGMKPAAFGVGRPILSILTPTIHGREWWLDRVRTVIEDARRILRQKLGIGVGGSIEWCTALFTHQNKGGPTIGEVRRRMVCCAMGSHAMFIDDDDAMARGGRDLADIVLAILGAERGRGILLDAVTFDVAGRRNTEDRWTFARHERGRSWEVRRFADIDAGSLSGERATVYDYERSPSHVNVIRTELLRKFPFDPAKTYAEDRDQSDRMAAAGAIESSIHLPQVKYVYETPDNDATREWSMEEEGHQAPGTGHQSGTDA